MGFFVGLAQVDLMQFFPTAPKPFVVPKPFFNQVFSLSSRFLGE